MDVQIKSLYMVHSPDPNLILTWNSNSPYGVAIYLKLSAIPFRTEAELYALSHRNEDK